MYFFTFELIENFMRTTWMFVYPFFTTQVICTEKDVSKHHVCSRDVKFNSSAILSTMLLFWIADPTGLASFLNN